MKSRVPNSQGRISNLVRFSEKDVDAIQNCVRERFGKLYEYYDASAKAYIAAVEGGEAVALTPTPFNVSYKALTVYLAPDLYEKLLELSKAHGVKHGREIATAITYLIRE